MKSKLQFILILGVIIFGLAILGYFNAIPGVKNQTQDLPKIKIYPQFFDFGEINYGQVVKYTFKVKNMGNEILEIKRVATSCSCDTAKIAKEKIEPGE